MTNNQITPTFIELGGNVIINIMHIVDIVRSKTDPNDIVLRTTGDSTSSNTFSITEQEYNYLRFLLLK